MSIMLWVFDVGLVAVLALLTALSLLIAVRATRHRPPAEHSSAGQETTVCVRARGRR